VLLVFVDGRDVTTAIREDAIGMGASTVSRHPPVRDALLAQQRQMADRGGVVMDGRDIGTVVLPQADLKIYLDADLDERARRRHEELLRRGSASSFDRVREALEARDKQDMNRDVAPLRVADDGVVVDSTDLTPVQMTEAVLALIRDRLPDAVDEIPASDS
jgi:cytidylate kinase